MRFAFAVAFLALAICGYNSWVPIARHAESSLTLYAKHAGNFDKFGGITPLEVSGHRLDYYDDYRHYYYIEHPAMAAWLIWLSHAVLGKSDWTTRLPFVLLAAACIPVFWMVARRVLPESSARLATAFFAFSPIFAYFSVATAHQVPTMFFILLGILFYLRWTETARRTDLALFFSLQFAACFCDWPGYYLALFVSAHALLVNRRLWKAAAASVGLNFLAFGVFLLWLYSLEPEGGACVKRLFFVGGSRSSSINLFSYAHSEARELLLYMTVPLVLLSLSWIVSCCFRGRRENRVIWCFLVFGADEIVFRQICFKHDYYTYYLILFVSLGAACLAQELASRLKGVALRRAALAAVIAAFAAQAGWVLQDRLTRQGGYLFYRDLGLALAEETGKEDKVLILVDDISHYTPYYGDRFALRYETSGGGLRYENMGKTYGKFDSAGLAEFVEEHASEFDFIVTARANEAVEGNAFFRGLGLRADSPILRQFHVLPEGHELERAVLEQSGRKTENRGFFFHHVRRGDP